MNLEYLWHLWESNQLVGVHSQIGARCLLHSLIVHHEKLLLEITGERRWATSGGLGGVFCFFITTSLTISVLGFTLMVLDTGFSIDSNAVVANHEKLSPLTWRERWAAIGRGLGVRLRTFLWDGVEHFVRKIYSELHHVYHWGRLVGVKEVDLIEVVDAAALDVVGEKMVHSVLTDRTCTPPARKNRASACSPSGRGVVRVERYAFSGLL